MATEWYYQSMGSEVGPVSSTELAVQARAGQISPETFVRRGPSGNWVLAEKVNGLFDGSAIHPVGAPTSVKPPVILPPITSDPPALPTVPSPVHEGATPKKTRIREVLGVGLAACMLTGVVLYWVHTQSVQHIVQNFMEEILKGNDGNEYCREAKNLYKLTDWNVVNYEIVRVTNGRTAVVKVTYRFGHIDVEGDKKFMNESDKIITQFIRVESGKVTNIY